MSIVTAVAVPHPPLIVPAVGRGEEARIQATIDAYNEAARVVVGAKPDVIVVTSPHAPLFRDGFHVTTDTRLEGSMARFRAPHERISARCDAQLAELIVRRANERGIVAGGSEWYRDDMDHGTYVPLYFVREAFRELLAGSAGGKEGQEAGSVAAEDARDLPCPVVRIALSGLSPQMHREFGHVIAQAADELGRRVAFVASGDLSHKLLPEGPYGFAPEGPMFDDKIGQIFASGDLEGLFDFDEDFCEAAAECGLRSFQIMAGALDGLPARSRMLSNEGPFGVGYGVAIVDIVEGE